MKRKILSIIFVIAMISSFMPTITMAETYGDLEYEIVVVSATVDPNRFIAKITDCDTSATEVVIPDKLDGRPVRVISKEAFKDCTNLTSITIPDSIVEMGTDAFLGCENLENVYISDVAKWCEIDFNNDSISSSSSNPLLYTDNLYINNKLITDLIIPEGIENISNGAFAGCDSLTSVTIPNSVTTIGNAFKSCPNLKSVVISDGVKSIGQFAFDNCSSLTNIHIGKGVESISTCAFEGCENLKNVYITDIAKWCNIDFSINRYYHSATPFYYGANLYINNQLATDLIIPDSVTSVKSYAFYNCNSLTSVTIPDSVISIGKSAFSCDNLISVAIGRGVENIETGAFLGCKNLKNVYIKDLTSYLNINFSWYSSNPMYCADNLYINNKQVTDIEISDEVEVIPDFAFNGCNSLRSIIIPNSIKYINYNAFKNCTGLENITIPNSVESIGDYAFYGCSGLKNIVIQNSVKDIGRYAFSQCSSVKSISIPDSIKDIKEGTFWNCSRLTSVIIPNSVTYIDYGAFVDCSNLKDVYYSGTEEEWNAITICEDNDPLENADIHFNSTGPTPLPQITAEIIKEETDIAYKFTVTPETAYEDCYVYAAVYNSDEILLGVNIVPLEMNGNTTVEVDKQENSAYAKVFIMADTQQPIINVEKIDL